MSFSPLSFLHLLLLLLGCVYNVYFASLCHLLLFLLFCSQVDHPQLQSAPTGCLCLCHHLPGQECQHNWAVPGPALPVGGRPCGGRAPKEDSMSPASHLNMVLCSCTDDQMATEPRPLLSAAGEVGTRAVCLMWAQCSHTCSCRRCLPCSCPQTQSLCHFGASQYFP